MTRLDKTKVGGYVKVIGRIAWESISPFIVILILLCGFLVALRNRSVYKGQDDTFDTINNFNGSFEYSFFQIYFMMAGDHQTNDMGVDNLTWPNLATFVIYSIFMFLITSLALNIFTGIAINEIRSLIEDSNIQIMKDKIDFIYDGGYSIFIYMDRFEVFREFKKWFFGMVTKVYRINWFVKKMIFYCTKCRDQLFTCVGTKHSEKKSNPTESDLTQMDLVDDKYIENFETLEFNAKKMEDKLDDRTDKLEKRMKKLEDKLDLLLDFTPPINRIKNLEDKFSTILSMLEHLRDRQ